MPAGWIAAGAGVLGVANSMGAFGGGPNQGSGSRAYTPAGLGAADTGWQNAFTGQQNIANQTMNTAMPAYQQSYDAAQGINYQPYQQAANQAGQQYGNLATAAQGQSGMYGQSAAADLGQQQQLYNAGNQLWNTSQQAANNQPLQQYMMNQAQQGGALANSMYGLQGPQAAGVEQQAMQTQNMNWLNQQQQLERGGLAGMAQASQAGAGQGQAATQAMQGQLASGQAGAGYTQQAAQVPMAAQQYIAGMPAANASAYGSNMAQLQTQQANVGNSANAYMQPGASQTNANNAFNAQNQMGYANLAMQGLAPQYGANGQPSQNSPNAWMNNLYSGGGSGSGVGTSDMSSAGGGYGGSTGGYGAGGSYWGP